jgi:DinB superfamily
LPSLKVIVQNLDRAQNSFLRAADAVPADQWQTLPGKTRWSAGELVGHLITIERAILRNLDEVLQKPPRALPFYKRVHFPMALVELRLIRRKTPLPTDSKLVREKEAMLAELREVRGSTLAFIDETRTRDLRTYILPHAFLGVLNIYEWLQMIASHEVRHTKQMREIASALPKVVANLQK